MPSLDDIIDCSILMLVSVGSIFLIGRAMLRSMLRKGQYRRAYHGQFVWYWVLLGAFVSLGLAAFLTDSGSYGGVLFLGVFTGWVIGMIHGLFMLAFVGPPSPPQTPPDPDGG